MKKRKALLMLTVLILAVMVPVLASASTKYVYKSNGHLTHVYSKASSGSKVITKLKSGTKINAVGTSGSYTQIKIDGQTGYVKTRNVVSSLPGKKSSTKTSSEDSLSSMNAEFRSMVSVTPYEIQVRPSQPSGYVNLRFGPSLSAEVITRLYQGYTLKVLAKGRSWLQVQDPATGQVGYIYTRYTSELN